MSVEIIGIIALAIGFMGVQLRAFAPSEITSALNFLLVPSSRHAAVLGAVESLKAQLAVIDKTPSKRFR